MIIDWVSVPSPDQRLALLNLAEAAALAAPGNAALQAAFGRGLIDVGRTEQAIEYLGDACRRLPDAPCVRAELARAYGRRGEVDASLALVRRWPEEPWSARLALRLLAKHRRLEEARAYEDAVAAIDPADFSLLEIRAERLRGDPRGLLRLAEAALAHDPGASHAIYYKAIALAQLGRPDDARKTMALDRFLSITALPTPFADAAAFNATVRQEILANPTLHADPAGHATRQGLRTGAYPLPGDRASTELTRSIRTAIGAYAAALQGEHPFVRARPRSATFVCWALVFREAGHQVVHHHPEPWLTGVYYVSAPDGTPRPGAIRIGILPEWAGVEPPWQVRIVEPEPGTLILFPSFVPHDTMPTGSTGERISIAFDVKGAA